MKVLVAEDEENIAVQYELILKDRKHDVTITTNGEVCLEAYHRELQQSSLSQNPFASRKRPPFDAVVLDYRMPLKDGLEVAREILAIQPKQRIMFASAYVQETLAESVKALNQVVELIQKPFDILEFADQLEDKSIWEGLEEMNIKIKEIKDLDPTHAEILGLLAGLQRLQKMRGIHNVS